MDKKKINLVGRLVAQKLGYTYAGCEVNSSSVDYNFINKEGFKRCYATNRHRIEEYCNYTDCNLIGILFNL